MSVKGSEAWSVSTPHRKKSEPLRGRLSPQGKVPLRFPQLCVMSSVAYSYMLGVQLSAKTYFTGCQHLHQKLCSCLRIPWDGPSLVEMTFPGAGVKKRSRSAF